MKINQRDVVAGVFLVFLAAIGMWLNTDHSMGTARRMGPGYMPWMVFALQALLGALVIFVSFGKREANAGMASAPPEGVDVARIMAVLIAAAGVWVFLLGEIGPTWKWDNATMFTLFGGAMVAGAIALWVRSPENEGTLQRWTTGEVASFVGGLAAGAAVFYMIRGTPGFIGTGYNAIGISMLVGFLVLSIPPGWRFLGLICACMCVFGLALERLGFYLALVGTIFLASIADKDHIRKPLGLLGLTAFLLVLCWFVFIRELDIRVNLWPN
jgi:hypothetical protein